LMKMESTLPEALNVFIRLSEVTLDWSEKPKKTDEGILQECVVASAK
jgi:hypothetical protein